jgi:hypothetical protein
MTRLRIAMALLAIALLVVLLDVEAEAATFPPNCGAGILTPVKRSGFLISRVEAECSDEAPIPYFRLNVSLVKRVEPHVWRTRASAIGVTSVVTSYFLIRVAAPCRLGTYRTNGVVEYRFDPSDPWTLAWRAHTYSMTVGRCPSDT